MTEAEDRTETGDGKDWWALTGGPVSRRALLRGSVLGVAGLTAAALIGCGDDDDDDDGAAAPTRAAAEEAPAAEPGGPNYVTQALIDGAPFSYNYPEPNETPRTGGVFKYPMTSGHSSHDPVVSQGASTVSGNSLMGDYVVGLNVGPTLNKFAIEVSADDGLAKSWEISPDGLTYTFDLRDANFHNVSPTNGRKLVANDVKLAYERMIVGTQSGIFSTMAGFEAPDENTFAVNMKIPDADVLIVMGTRFTPIYAPEPYDEGIQDTTPIGTGAMIFDGANTAEDQVMAFKANPDYWDGAPLLDGFELLTIPDSATREAAFRTGQVHFGRQPAPELFKTFFDEIPGLQVSSDPVLWGTSIYAVNSQIEPFNDVRVRRGLKLAMDLGTAGPILQPNGWVSGPAFGFPFVFGDQDFGEAGAPWLSKNTLTTDEFGPYWKHDVAEAKKLLAAAGAEKLKWRHIGPSQFSGDATSAEAVLLESLKEVDAEIEFLNVPFTEFGAQYYGQGFSNASGASESLSGWSTATPTANGYFWENVHSESSTNHFAVKDPEVDRLADAQRSEGDPQRRQEFIRELFDYMNDQAYWLDKWPAAWTGTWLGPEVRFYRFNAPFIGIHWFWDWGYGVHKAWLGDPLKESPTTFNPSSGLVK